MIDIAAAVRRLREARGMTQTDLAAASGVRQSTIGNIESGNRGAKGQLPGVIHQVAAGLGIGLDELLAEAGFENRHAKIGTPVSQAPVDSAGAWPFRGATWAQYQGLSATKKRELDRMVGHFFAAAQEARPSRAAHRKSPGAAGRKRAANG